MKRLAAVAAVLGVVAALSGCATPCCFCYCGDVPTRGPVDVSTEPAPRPEIAPSLKPIVVARY